MFLVRLRAVDGQKSKEMDGNGRQEMTSSRKRGQRRTAAGGGSRETRRCKYAHTTHARAPANHSAPSLHDQLAADL